MDCKNDAEIPQSSALPPHFLEVLQLEITKDSLVQARTNEDHLCVKEQPSSNGQGTCSASHDLYTDTTSGERSQSDESSLTQALHTLSLEVTEEGIIVNDDSSTGDHVSQTDQSTYSHTLNGTDEKSFPSLQKYYGISTSSCDKMDFDYILLVHGFHPSMKTKDIVRSLCVSSSENFQIKWVDDTHALAIYADSEEAFAASKEFYAEVEVEMLSKSSHEESWAVARKCGASIRKSLIKKETKSLIVAKRPPTTASVARRMVGHALGVRISPSPEQREKERKEVEEVKLQKQKKAKRTSGLI